MTEDKKRKPRRTKADIADSIHQAAEDQIIHVGFTNIKVSDIIKHAKIEPAVFYNRYNNLEVEELEMILDALNVKCTLRKCELHKCEDNYESREIKKNNK